MTDSKNNLISETLMEATNAFPPPRVLTGLPALDSAFGELNNTKGTRVGTMNMIVYKLQSQVEEIRDIFWTNIQVDNKEVFFLEPEELEEGKAQQPGVLYYNEYLRLVHLFMTVLPNMVHTRGGEGSVFVIRLSQYASMIVDGFNAMKLENLIRAFRCRLQEQNKTVFFILSGRVFNIHSAFSLQSDTVMNVETLNIHTKVSTEVLTALHFEIHKNKGGPYGKNIYTTA